VNGGPA
jgi:hypothetical protein